MPAMPRPANPFIPFTLRAPLAALATAALAACAPEETVSPAPVKPFLSDEPLWLAEGPLLSDGSCFGTSVAAGDLNGDARTDVVVTIPPCSWELESTASGRLAVYAGGGALLAAEPILV